MMNDSDLINRLRITLNDLYGKFWSDSQLKLYIDEAKKEYCTRIPLLFQWVPVLRLEDNKFYWDEKFIKYQYGETLAGNIIYPSTDRNICYHDKALIDNGDGTFRLIGIPDDGEYAVVEDLSGVGLDVDVDTFDNWVFEYDKQGHTRKGLDDKAKRINAVVNSSLEFFGLDVDSSFENTPFGICNIQTKGRPIAYLHCQRMSYDGIWEVNDIPPIVFYSASLALRAETDRKNLDIAQVCLTFFENIVNARANRNLTSLKTINRGSFL